MSKRLAVMIGLLMFLGLGAICMAYTPQNVLPIASGQILPGQILKVAILEDAPPLNYINADNKLVGMNVDIIREMARRSGYADIELKSVSYNRLMMGLLYHQYDVVAAPQTMTPERAKVVQFLPSYHTSTDSLIFKTGRPAQFKNLTLKDIQRKKLTIGVFNGTSYPRYLTSLGLDKNMVVYPTQREMVLALLNGKVDLIVADTYVAQYFKTERNFPFELVDQKLRTDKIAAFSVRKEDAGLSKQLESSLSAMKADGTLSAIRFRWLKSS